MAIAAPTGHGPVTPLSSLAPGVFCVLFHGSVLAAKVLDMEQLSDGEMESLVLGVRLSRSLRHQNLLPFVTAFLQNSRIWFLSPFCDLRSASDLCQPYGLREILISVIMRDTLKGLEYLHDRGIIHRAICGSHILIQSEGRCLLTGFNYATNVVKNGLWRTSLHDFPHGAKKNLIFLAPEILEQNLLGYNQKSDMYSLGVTCCELANGVAPYWNLEPAEMLLDKLTGNHAKPIDSSCTQYIRVPGELTGEDRERYDAYKSRRFSDHFHRFSILNLNSDPVKRPTAAQLLGHRFFKQLKKESAMDLFSSLVRHCSDRTKSHTSLQSHKDDDVEEERVPVADVQWNFQ